MLITLVNGIISIFFGENMNKEIIDTNSINIILNKHIDSYYQRFNQFIFREIYLAYSGGLIDGEGCIGIYYNNYNHNYQLRISVEMVNKEGLEILSFLFGGKWYNQKAKNPRRAKYKWMIFNSQAANTLKELLPYLFVKQEHAKVALLGNWHKYIGGKKLSAKEKQIRQKICNKMKELNKRGYYE